MQFIEWIALLCTFQVVRHRTSASGFHTSAALRMSCWAVIHLIVCSYPCPHRGDGAVRAVNHSMSGASLIVRLKIVLCCQLTPMHELHTTVNVTCSAHLTTTCYSGAASSVSRPGSPASSPQSGPKRTRPSSQCSPRRCRTSACSSSPSTRCARWLQTGFLTTSSSCRTSRPCSPISLRCSPPVNPSNQRRGLLYWCINLLRCGVSYSSTCVLPLSGAPLQWRPCPPGTAAAVLPRRRPRHIHCRGCYVPF
jgi:hypothetical protein